MKLHFNKSNKQFTIRNETRMVESYTRKRVELPPTWQKPLGDIVTLAPMVHVIVTRGNLVEASTKYTRPDLKVVVTKFPLWHLLIARIKEVI